MRRYGLLAGLWLLLLSVTFAHAEQVRLIRLNYADATVVAASFGGASTDAVSRRPDPDAFVRESIANALRRLPAADGQWLPAMMARSAPEQGGGPALQVPVGLSQPPVAIPAQNALLVRGSGEAIDQLQEILSLLDRPVPMVSIDCRMVDQPREQVDEWGIDFQAFNGDVAVGTTGNAPVRGLLLHYGVGNLQALIGRDLRNTRGNETTGASVTTFDNTDAFVAFGEDLPFFVSHVTYDWWGTRQVYTEPYSIFTGIEMFVHPRITGDDTVTMHLRPNIVEAAGQVTAPDGSNIPITRRTLTDTTVRVADGQSLVISGFNRLSDSQMDNFRGLLGGRRITRSSNPVLIVTPHIIRPQ